MVLKFNDDPLLKLIKFNNGVIKDLENVRINTESEILSQHQSNNDYETIEPKIDIWDRINGKSKEVWNRRKMVLKKCYCTNTRSTKRTYETPATDCYLHLRFRNIIGSDSY